MRVGPMLIAVTICICGCSSFAEKPQAQEDEIERPPGGPGRASAEELRIYLDEVQPEAIAVLRYKEPLRWTPLNNYFAIMEARNGPHLIEMAWECKELRGGVASADMADRRSKRGILRARIDTLRGCRIQNFYKLPETQEQEDDRNPGAGQ